MIKLPYPLEFIWDKGNKNKNRKHNVTDEEAEEIFYNELTFIIPDEKHSEIEKRYSIKGTIQNGRKLVVIVTRENMKKLKPIPQFKNEDEEREFWWNHDSTEYFDWSKAEIVTFPNLKPTTRKNSIRYEKSATKHDYVFDKNDT